MLNKKTIIGTTLLTCLLASPLSAKVSSEEAARLGNDLTPMGAEKAGNADGTIPEWRGGITQAPAGFTPGDHHIDPYSGDSVLFTITAENYKNYADKLSAGQIALFETYPDSYKMNVYPSHRSASYPDYVYEATKANATRAELADGGNGLKGAAIGAPFPLPQNGLEAIWNHIVRFRGVKVSRNTGQAAPQPNGSYVLVKLADRLDQIYTRPGLTPEELEKDNILFKFKQTVSSPARLAGTALLVHETLDQVKEPRKAWTYNTGQRRVRRAPNVAYDAPGTAADGLRTTDDFDMYNGSPDRYNWRIVGKKEMYIPYNTYQLHSDEVQYDDIIQPGVINQALVRYELHRVWEVEATLKEGTSHQYARRVFYLDEDSWQASISDIYDGRGELWRVAMAHAINYYEVPALWSTLETYYDLPSKRYLAIGLDNQEDMYDFNADLKSRDFTPAALRRSGVR